LENKGVVMSKLQDFLKEQPDLERFDVPLDIISDINQIGKDLITLAKKAKKMDGAKFTSKLRDLYDEMDAYIRDMEDYRSGG
jgi:hypothetical protein